MKFIYSIVILLAFAFNSIAQHPERGAAAFEGVDMAKRVSKIPDFTQYKVVQEKKKDFFDLLRPMVKEENQVLMNEHKRIEGLFGEVKSGKVLAESDLNWLQEMAVYYRVTPFDINNPEDQETLLRRVDIIPESLFLAQAANESAWGTSRFAKAANNIFGQWCFTEGCGIVPSQRKAGENHEVQKFETINDAVTVYMHHLNSHPFYVKLRDSRAASRKKGEEPSGYAMAVGLEKYSARGAEYVKTLRSMIRYNKLEVLN
jgi:Bax protein